MYKPNLKQIPDNFGDYSIKKKTFTHRLKQKYVWHSGTISNKNHNHTKGDNASSVSFQFFFMIILFKPCELLICTETTMTIE